ncbi:MAG: DNA polymerase III subunit gamma/tau [Chlamydiae bacterium]|nr:DNA polymerase III subunit gamma/tau [Chlamydiota bacterium]
MEYQVLARKWRPQQFDEVVGQGHVTTTLKNAIARNRVGHSYLFTGPRGIGKTSTARILAKALNCAKGPTDSPCDACPSCTAIVAGNSLDVLEIDGASNRGIEQIRELRENVKFAPASSRYKIYIIDEVHQITSDAFNALLKTLEEPPAHVKFFFATTEPYKVPSTILSRCQRFDLRAISIGELVDHLARIAASEKIKIDEEARFAIARYAQGSMRDAESILDQLVSFAEGTVTGEKVIAMLGMVRESVLRDITEALIAGDCRRGLELIDAIASEGKELTLFFSDWIGYLRSILLSRTLGGDEHAAGLSAESWKAVKDYGERFALDRLLYVLDLFTKAEGRMRRSLSPRILIELAFLKAARSGELASVGELLEKIRLLEERLGGRDGGPAPGGRGGRPPRPEPSGGDPPPFIARSREAERKERPSGPHRVPPQEAVSHPARPRGAVAVPIPPAGGEPRERPAHDAPGAEQNPGAASRPAVAMKSEELLARVREIWHDVLDRVGMVRPMLKSCLIEGTPVAFEDGVLRIEFPEERAYQCDSLEHPGSKGLVKRVLGERLGGEIGVKFSIVRKAAKEEGPGRPAAPRKEIQNLKKNPMIQSAIEMFKAQVVEVKR